MGLSVLKCRILALYVPLQATCSESVPTFFTTIDTSGDIYAGFAISDNINPLYGLPQLVSFWKHRTPEENFLQMQLQH